jgi:hypothetical protein
MAYLKNRTTGRRWEDQGRPRETRETRETKGDQGGEQRWRIIIIAREGGGGQEEGREDGRRGQGYTGNDLT